MSNMTMCGNDDCKFRTNCMRYIGYDGDALFSPYTPSKNGCDGLLPIQPNQRLWLKNNEND